MKIEIMLDMEAIGEDDTILVQDEFGEYPDCEYVPKSTYDRIEAENAKLRKLFYEAWDWMQRVRYDGSVRDDEMDKIGAKAVKLGFPDYELGIEVDEWPHTSH